MRIRVIEAPVATSKGKYTELAVTFRNLSTDKVDVKKVFSFTYPDVFATLKDAKPDSVWTITSVKNDKGYWDWTAVTDKDEPAESKSDTSKPATKAPDRGFETPSERAYRQVLIVRQNALSNAVALLGQGAKREDVFKLADEMAGFVFTGVKVDAIGAILKMRDDLPL